VFYFRFSSNWKLKIKSKIKTGFRVTKDILFTFLHNRTDEWRAVEEHAVVAVVVVLFTYLLPPMQPPLTQSLVVHFLDLRSNTSNTWITQR